MSDDKQGRLGSPLPGSCADVEIHVGQVWRKHGPADWFRITHIMIPGHPQFEDGGGGDPGVSVQERSDKGRWLEKGWWISCSSVEGFVHQMVSGFRYSDSESGVREASNIEMTKLWKEFKQIEHDIISDARAGKFDTIPSLAQSLDVIDAVYTAYDHVANGWPLRKDGDS